MTRMSGRGNEWPFRLNHMTSSVHPMSPAFMTRRQNYMLTAMKKSSKEKCRKLFKLLVLTAIPTLIVVAQSVINLNEDYQVSLCD